MMIPEITAHIIVQNEDQFVWYAIQSVLPYVTRCLIYDTGSEDTTISIINSIQDKKIEFSKIPVQSAEDISLLRQRQLDETKTDWFWVVDGDEVYTDELCQEICGYMVEDPTLEGIVVGRYDLIGDIYHYQKESVGTYNIFGRKGHFVLRLMNRSMLPGLHIKGRYPYEGYYDKKGIEIIHHDKQKYQFTQQRMFHAMYLKRSSYGANLYSTFHRKKWKIEKGLQIPNNIQMPEVLYGNKPGNVPDIMAPRSLFYEAAASVITPIKQIKRALIPQVI